MIRSDAAVVCVRALGPFDECVGQFRMSMIEKALSDAIRSELRDLYGADFGPKLRRADGSDFDFSWNATSFARSLPEDPAVVASIVASRLRAKFEKPLRL